MRLHIIHDWSNWLDYNVTDIYKDDKGDRPVAVKYVQKRLCLVCKLAQYKVKRI